MANRDSHGVDPPLTPATVMERTIKKSGHPIRDARSLFAR